ncbi:MAG: single-stranded-DNA-specific exonuclease RecJ [Bacteroidaceae bacterium]|nr:single-stranded-DNA-specific exonuclease RecJ [Bacteroidaceae bacterium]
MAAATALAHKLNIAPILADILIKRGIEDETAANKFFRPQLTDLYDPFIMKDMDIAVDRLNEAMGRKERILVYGDYDVDGVTSVTLVYKFLNQYYSNIDYYIPDRYDEGYGISKRGIDYAKDTGVTLIIVLDSGIKAIEQIAYAKSLGIDFIVCDHHEPDEKERPDAVAILDPKQRDCAYPFKELCGCGVGFKFMQAFALSNMIPFSKLIPMLDLCAMSIAADLVAVNEENRILAYHGLKQINKNPSVGLRALIEVCGLSNREITMSDIVFKIAPRINASGRMENGRESVDLLVEKDYSLALEIAKNINEYNEQRRDIDKQMTEEANIIIEMIESQEQHSSIVLYDEGWKKGIIGIVASRVTEMYYKPTIVLTRDGDYAVGSARSVTGFDIYSAVKSCSDLFVNFGGHTCAAGMTLRWQNLNDFRIRFQKYVDDHIDTVMTDPPLTIDAELKFSDIDKKFCSDLKKFAPFGPQNQKPVFCTHRVMDYGTSRVVGRNQEHIKLELIDLKSPIVMNGIAFGQSEAAKYIKSKHAFDIVYTIEDNHYKHSPQLQIEDIKEVE